MNYKKYAITAMTAALLAIASCSEQNLPGVNDDCDPRLLTGINALMGQSESRAYVPLTDPDYIGRKDFANGDKLVFTTIKRTNSPIGNYTYAGIVWNRTGGGWNRDENDEQPENIYWSDGESGHTFTAYSLPVGEFAWEEKGGYYFGKLGNFTTDEATAIDYCSTFGSDFSIAPADSGSIRLRRDDLVLSHKTDLVADPGGSIATVRFNHALSFVYIKVNINGFAASSTAEDTKSRVHDMEILSQPIYYKWNKASSAAEPLSGSESEKPDWITDATAKKALKACIFNPKGQNNNQYKEFIFTSLAVPTTEAGSTMQMRFKVTYPDPLRPNTATVTKTYVATINGVKLYAGKRTQINITLRHTDETMTVGAEYHDWEFVSTPDNSNLTKKSTFLSYVSRDSVTTHTDPKATEDDATWLYYKRDTNGNVQKDAEGNDIILDVYGNDGSQEKPYIIATADQLLSFAYEVKEEFDFTGKSVKLDAAITMQPKLSTQATDANAVHWIGIGDNEHAFNGRFLGYSRQLSGQLGKPLFIKTGADAFVEHISLKNVLGVDGGGAAVETNGGILGACIIEGDVIYTPEGGEATTYCGSLAAVNEATGHILSCVHLGKVQGPDYVGGLVGLNKGHIVASYHTGYVISTSSENSKVYGTVAKSDNGKVFGIYFNSDYLPRSNELGGKSTTDLQNEEFVDEINGWKRSYITNEETGLTPGMIDHYRTQHDFHYRPGAYPLPD
ncbi:MAG: hypothetical protein ACI4UN_06265 [Muribaculaceae bacterium]